MSLVPSLKLKKRADLAEGRIGPQHGDEAHLFVKLLTEADEKSIDEDTVVDVIPKLPEFITDRLDPLAEDGDRGVSLDDGAELGVESVDTGVGVVLKQLLKRGPKLGCGGVVVGDKIEELGRDPSIIHWMIMRSSFTQRGLVGCGTEDGCIWWRRPQRPGWMWKRWRPW